jgi:uncharacterized protein with von Willebrand factor type A (vWA) domain
MTSSQEFLSTLRNRAETGQRGKRDQGGMSKAVRRALQRIEPETRQNIVTTRWDDKVWTEARELDQMDRDILDLMSGNDEEERDGYDNAPELVRDLFATLYKSMPRFEDKRKVEKDARLNRRIIEEILKSPDYERLHDMTQMDPVSSAVATQEIVEHIRELLKQHSGDEGVVQNNNQQRRSREQDKKSKPEKGEKGQQPPGEPQDGDGEPEDGEGDGQPQDGDGEPQEGDGKTGGNDAPKQSKGDKGDDKEDESEPESEPEDKGDGDGKGDESEGDPDDEDGDPEDESDEDGDGGDPNANNNGFGDDDEDFEDDERDLDAGELDDPDLDDAADGDDDEHDPDDDEIDNLDLDRFINRALHDMAEEMEELTNQRHGIGLEDGEWRTMSPADREEWAERLMTPQMRALADIIGRMKTFAMGVQAEKIDNSPHEIYDVGRGNNFPDLLQSEMLLAAAPETEAIFFQRFLDGETLEYKKRGRKEAGLGPMVICIDKSGSMQGAKFNWAMAVAEALRRIANEQGRDYYAMFFGNNNDRERFPFPKGEQDFRKVYSFLSAIANGGTQFDGVLTEALQKCRDYFTGDAAMKADITFITDGLAGLTPEWIDSFNDQRKEMGVRLYSVFIGGARDYHSGTNSAVSQLEKFSDIVIPITELKPESVRQVFLNV